MNRTHLTQWVIDKLTIFNSLYTTLHTQLTIYNSPHPTHYIQLSTLNLLYTTLHTQLTIYNAPYLTHHIYPIPGVINQLQSCWFDPGSARVKR